MYDGVQYFNTLSDIDCLKISFEFKYKPKKYVFGKYLNALLGLNIVQCILSSPLERNLFMKQLQRESTNYVFHQFIKEKAKEARGS